MCFRSCVIRYKHELKVAAPERALASSWYRPWPDAWTRPRSYRDVIRDGQTIPYDKPRTATGRF